MGAALVALGAPANAAPGDDYAITICMVAAARDLEISASPPESIATAALRSDECSAVRNRTIISAGIRDTELAVAFAKDAVVAEVVKIRAARNAKTKKM